MQPWFKVYAGDYLLDDGTFELKPEAEGLLLRMWCLCWRDGYAPADPEKLALKIRRPTRYVRAHFDAVRAFFAQDGDRLTSRRLESERSLSAEKTARNSASGRIGAEVLRSKRLAAQSLANTENTGGERHSERFGEKVSRQSQSQSQIKKSPSDSCAEPRSGAVSAPSPDCPEFPTKGPVRSWQATADQVARWRELYPGLDVRHELLKAHTWIVDHPAKRKTARGMAGFITSWLGRATNQPRGFQPNPTLPAAPPKPPRVQTRRDLLAQEIRDAEAFKRTDRVAELRRRLAEAERNGTADDPIE